MSAGKEFGLKPGHTSSIRRIEGGMLSYHADADINTNPYELGLDRLVNLDIENNFVGKEALKKINTEGIKRKQVGVILDCEPLEGPNTTFWRIIKDNKEIGKITSAVYSPRLKKNIALAMVVIDKSKIGTEFDVEGFSKKGNAVVVEKPYALYSPNAFSPDGDGINDFFKISGQGMIDFQIEIFNRWGQMVYKSLDLSNGWDGTFKGKNLPTGTYVYKIKTSKYGLEQKLVKSGSVALVR